MTLSLDGTLTGPWVGELRAECDSALAERRRLSLDLSGLGFLDASGVRLLLALRERDVQLRNPSPLVVELLKRSEP
ncbi:MAG TPA: STAS domain-containing protein [Vicinamibacteria bacterium]|nr:STAS domain-containing protein [Vicinamibacteria bacterium]